MVSLAIPNQESMRTLCAIPNPPDFAISANYFIEKQGVCEHCLMHACHRDSSLSLLFSHLNQPCQQVAWCCKDPFVTFLPYACQQPITIILCFRARVSNHLLPCA